MCIPRKDRQHIVVDDIKYAYVVAAKQQRDCCQNRNNDQFVVIRELQITVQKDCKSPGRAL